MKSNHVFKAIAIAIAGLAVLVYACTPAVSDATMASAPPPSAPVVKPKTDCKTWLGSPQQSAAEDAHVLYRDAFRAGNIDEAFENWQLAYSVGPAADGLRDYHFTDGAKIYAAKLAKADTEAEKKQHIATIESLYEEAAKCYPENASKYYGLLAFDQYYKYEGLVDRSTVYDTFKKSIDLRGDSAHYFTINPFTAVMIDMLLEEKIPMAEGQHYAGVIMKSISYGKMHCKGRRECQPWEIIEDYAPVRLADLEGLEGFYDCEYYREKYFQEFLRAENNCEVVQDVYSKLKWAKCPIGDPDFQQIKQVRDANCLPKIVVAAAPGPLRTAYNCLQEAQYNCAIENFQIAIERTDDPLRKAKYAMLIAKIHYAHLKNFRDARRFARAAAQFDPTTGEPYILIGKLYASSGPLCGPGRGWDSQVVTWVAIDEWRKGRQLDPNVAAEANKLIDRYKQYMPSGEDIFQRTLTEGDNFKVGCWIQQITKITRAPN